MKKLNRYIDVCLIDEYATKDHQNGWTLDTDDLPKHEIENFLHELMQHDTSVRDTVLSQMQKLIDERLLVREVDARWDAGLQRIQLANGDTFIGRMGV